MRVRKQVWPHAIEQPAQSINYQENPDDPGDVARPVDQVAQQPEMNESVVLEVSTGLPNGSLCCNAKRGGGVAQS